MDKWIFRALIALMTAGLLVSIYMTVYKITSNDSMCLGSGDCSTVNASRYSEVNGIPVALVGVVGYVLLLGTLFMERRSLFFHAQGPLIGFGLSLTGFMFTLWLVYVEIVLLQAICPFCVTSQVSITLIFVLSVVRLFKNP